MFGPYVQDDRRTCVAPVLPARDLLATAAFYRTIGFDVVEISGGGGYVIARLDWVELHFFPSPHLDPERNDAGAFIRVVDADATEAALLAAFPANSDQEARLLPFGDKPWGMRQGGFLDIDRNLIQFGAPLEHKRWPKPPVLA